jgi:hypothetical protein
MTAICGDSKMILFVIIYGAFFFAIIQSYKEWQKKMAKKARRM